MSNKVQCSVEGCTRLVMSKGNGYYSGFCTKHHKEKYGMPYDRKAELRDEGCMLCGWIGPCDLHRLKTARDNGKYTKGNVVTVCPNCHRLLHRGLLLIK